ncbi:MAG: hypothetical protein CO029_01390 [Candidatus Magasanikbacteria bacterium CG_4_9_14_0_2_um_filter_41_10]|nr:MAG: hypothetical protein AUJ37_03530 [Candidatus Magasanikbacteria bacterium CG1_02_41_34]PJC53699.1 MAG: hypothetical protein CO029_01390 [Candidatus Magasanikbacteria bacterium CG_4_9_14_0_2_um_filter_41_10]
MEENITLKDVFTAVQGVKDEVRGLKNEVQGVKDEVQGVKDEVQGVKDKVQNLKELVLANQESIEFIKDNAVTKDEMKEELTKVRNEITEHVDGFVGLYKDHDTELATVILRQQRQEKKIKKIMVHVGM